MELLIIKSFWSFWLRKNKIRIRKDAYVSLFVTDMKYDQTADVMKKRGYHIHIAIVSF